MNVKLLGCAAVAASAWLAGCASTAVADNRCNGACSSHSDGYEWAQQMNLEDVRQCAGDYPDDFARGCRDAVNDFAQMRPASKGL